MTFGEKVRQERTKLKLTQDELATKMGVTRRVITSYESDKSRPRGIDNYKKLAEALGVNVNYLLSEDDAFLAAAEGKYGSRGAKQASELISEVSGLFAGGEMAEEDMDEMMKAIQDAYWIAKKNNKKYTPKKYRKDDDL
jgi:transcriptional regulator with XRE-family HTH domain